jgi:hypothetical protein
MEGGGEDEGECGTHTNQCCRNIVGQMIYKNLLYPTCPCRMDLPGPTTSVGTRTDYSVGPWDYPTCAARYLMA